MARRNGGPRVGGRNQKLSQTLPSFGAASTFESKQKNSTTREWLPPPQWKAAATSAGWVGAVDLESTLDQSPSMSKTYSDPGLLPKIQWERASTASAKSADGTAKDEGVEEIKSPSFNLKRENHQLRRELEQMEISLLESFRRGDRFMSGGKCLTKGNQPVMQAYLRDKEELRRARERSAQLEDELRRALSRVEALEIERDMHGDARNGELTDQARAFAEDNEMLRNVAEAQSKRALEFEEIAKRAEEAQQLAQEESAARYQALKEMEDQLQRERSEWAAARSQSGGAVASTQTSSEPVLEETTSAPQASKDTMALQTWLARWAGENPKLTLGLCFRAWYREANLELRMRAAELAKQMKSERDSSIIAHGMSKGLLEEERRRLEESLKEKEALERDRRRLTLEGDEAKEMCKSVQKDMDKLWQKTNAAEQALSRERKELERLREDSLLQRRQDKSKEQQALDAAELRLKKAEMACEEAWSREATLKAELARLLAQQEGTQSSENMERELQEKCEELEEVKADRDRCKNQRRRVEERLHKVAASYDELKGEKISLLEQLDKLQQNAAKEQLRQMFRLQVLAPSVTVTLSQMKAMDVKAAPAESQIRKVMMERVLPQFTQVLLHDDSKDNTNASAQTSQLVQSVVSGMVSSIEDKLQSLLGTGCVRISMKT
eukprot:gnl/MRDRNA2_/MRDRNA2_93834_c0_seq1.p1 gnl/MRDRNA2_/MRDRNA2_93834_c0~~gnl/MRDRNA2_/MRDRNA2_93834_c0_seq1.p1  ORF type:complete len:669 (+),score=187.36 gnl/MRDRNA2_/MRDRNA2_93834_c0_seq1:79-2085(+)